MAVNQVSLFFYPPRWQQRVTVKRLTDAGHAVHIADSVPIEGACGPAVQVSELKRWLTAQGFSPPDLGGDSLFQRGQIHSIFGPEKEVEVEVSAEAGEVTELYCRFTLPRSTPPPLTLWAEFVVSLCGRFGMRLGAEDTAVCGASQFLAAVRGSPNYREFAASFGW